MLYHLFEFIQTNYDVPGAGVFQYISFRAAASVITSLICSMVIGKRVIEYLQLR